MALTEIYVDPSIAADSGAGTLGDPFGDLEYAIVQTTFNLSGGTRVNVKAGTQEVLVADLATAMADTSVAAAWVPTNGDPCVIQGYTATAGDGGKGDISGGGLVSIISDVNLDNTHIIDLIAGDCGANRIFWLDNECSVLRSELHTSTHYGLQAGNYIHVESCYFHDINDNGGNVINCSTIGMIRGNWFEDCDVGVGEVINATGALCDRNIIILAAADNDGIRILNSAQVINNSIYQPFAGTGAGIITVDATSVPVIENNLIEGFSGVGGRGVDINNDIAYIMKGNAAYDCTTPYESAGTPIGTQADNETLSASPFTDAANGDFSPVDTGNVKGGSLPQAWPAGSVNNVISLDKGAVQPTASGGGGMKLAGRGGLAG